MEFSFIIFGVPQPQGSTRAFIPRGWTRPVITTDNTKLKPWRQQLSLTAIAAMNEQGVQIAVRGVPVSITMNFVFERPRSEKKSAIFKTVKPDIDKLIRGILDALTGVCFVDDSQVADCHATKVFGSPARVEIHVRSQSGTCEKPSGKINLQLFETASGEPHDVRA